MAVADGLAIGRLLAVHARALDTLDIAGLDATQHMVTNAIIDVTADGRTATCRSSGMARVARHPTTTALDINGATEAP
jgi:hypothetical protein